MQYSILHYAKRTGSWEPWKQLSLPPVTVNFKPAGLVHVSRCCSRFQRQTETHPVLITAVDYFINLYTTGNLVENSVMKCWAVLWNCSFYWIYELSYLFRAVVTVSRLNEIQQFAFSLFMLWLCLLGDRKGICPVSLTSVNPEVFLWATFRESSIT